MRPTISLSDLLTAYEWVSAAARSENAAYVSRETGHIFWDPEAAGIDEELPEQVEDDTLFARVPHKHDLDLGQNLVFRFIEEAAPDAYAQVRSIFSRRGAYARYKDFLERRGLLEAWYAYEQRSLEEALREWAESEDLELARDPRDTADGPRRTDNANKVSPSTPPRGAIEVRAPLASDLPAVHALLSADGWAHRIPDAAWLEQLLANSQALVAVCGAEVVGFARGITDGLSNGYLSMVVVAEEHRRQGIGSRLVQELTGAQPEVTWVLRAERPGAREFFERIGFAASSSAMERTRQLGR